MIESATNEGMLRENKSSAQPCKPEERTARSASDSVRRASTVLLSRARLSAPERILDALNQHSTADGHTKQQESRSHTSPYTKQSQTINASPQPQSSASSSPQRERSLVAIVLSRSQLSISHDRRIALFNTGFISACISIFDRELGKFSKRSVPLYECDRKCTLMCLQCS